MKAMKKIRGMQILNLNKKFELPKMKYSDELLSIANKVRLLGSTSSDSKIV